MIRIAFCVWIALGSGAVAAEEVAGRPNVVVFLADDAGWGDFGRNGNTTVRTPRIDSLARDGVTFDRFYVCPVCAPTRAEFLTGRYYLRTGVRGVSTGQERLNLDEKTVADAFRSAGYATGAFGKWHNGSQWPYHPNARGFEEYYGHTAGHWGEYFDPPLDHNGQPVRAEGYIVDVCTDRALAFIEQNCAKPFFCYVPFTTPHTPWAVPEEYWRRLKHKPIEQPASLPDREEVDQTRCALAMMENQDWNVGRVLDKLDALGLAKDTIVVYFSDNGPNSWRYNGGMRGRKGSTDEGGVRSAMFMRWPARLPAGRTVTEIAGAIDLLPTLTALANVARVGDKPMDGRDLSPLLLGSDKDWPSRSIVSTWAGKLSLRTQRHRLDAEGRLYDMVADPGQTRQVNGEQAAVAAQLTEAAATWRKELLPAAGLKARGSVDPRPIPVGYPEFRRTWLPARDGEPHGAIERSARAPNCSYFVHWTSEDDSITWNIDVATAGRYAVQLQYTCPPADAGATVELSFCGSRTMGKVAPGWDPPLYTNQDTLPRPPAESRMKEFRALDLGVITLQAGQGPLVLRALDIPGRTVMDLRSVTLTLLP